MERVRFSFLNGLRLVTILSVATLIVRRVLIFVDPDFGWHLRTGEWIALHRAVPATDIYSYAMEGVPWVNHEWLFDLGLWLTHEYTALIALIFCLFVFVPFTVWIMRAKSALSLIWISLAAVMIFETIGVRAQTLSFFIFSLLGLLLARGLPLSRFARHVLPLLFLIWANVHGGFFGGLVIWGIALFAFAVENRRNIPRTLYADTASLLVALACTLVNPYGLHLYEEVFNTIGTKTIAYVSEWQSGLLYWPFLLGVFLALSAVMLFAQKKRPPLAAVLLFAFLSIEVLLHARMVGIFVAVTAPFMLIHIDRFAAILDEHARYRRHVAFGAAIIILALFARAFASPAFGSPWHPPKGALSALARFPSADGAETLVDFNLAGSAIGLDPTRKVFAAGYRPHGVDQNGWSPTEAYLDMTMRERDAWKKYFREYNIDTVLLQKTPLDLAAHLNKPASNDRPPKWAKTVARVFGLNQQVQQFSLAEDLKAAGWCVVYRDLDAQILRAPNSSECRNLE